MNTNTIAKTEQKKYQSYSELPAEKSKLVFTKHLTNFLHHDPKCAQMLFWFSQFCTADNVFQYSTVRLQTYCAYLQLVKGKNTNITDAREIFKQLIEDGHVLATDKPKHYMINPVFLFNPNVLPQKDYNRLVKTYNGYMAKSDTAGFVKFYCNQIINVLLIKKGRSNGKKD